MLVRIYAMAAVLSIASLAEADSGIHLRAEEGTLQGLCSKIPLSADGPNAVGGFFDDNSRVILTVHSDHGGVFGLTMHFASVDQAAFLVSINGLQLWSRIPDTQGQMQPWFIGRIELAAGNNQIAVQRRWGAFEIETLDLAPLTISPPVIPSATLCDPAATDRTRKIFAFLLSHYGQNIFSGQYGNSKPQGFDPAILGGDFMDYSPSRIQRGSNPKDLTESLIKKIRGAGKILTLSWHWNAPAELIDKDIVDQWGQKVDAHWYRGFYTDATTFDLEKALSDEHSSEYQLLLRDIDAIAVQLQKLSDADIPILWRPLHEAEGGWFWWGAKGPKPFIKLWQLMYDRLINVHHLHNLIWVYTSDGNMDWYPGDQYVDIVGIDSYPVDWRDPNGGLWDRLNQQLHGRKLLAITESSAPPDVPRMWHLGCDWSYFVAWDNPSLPAKMTQDDVRTIYSSPEVYTLTSDLQNLTGFPIQHTETNIK